MTKDGILGAVARRISPVRGAYHYWTRRNLPMGRWTGEPTLVDARHAEWSVISSADDLSPAPSKHLIDLALAASTLAAETDLAALSPRATGEQRSWLDLWPGEHYRLLSALATVLQAERVVEIGTFTGMGALSLLAGMTPAGVLVTYDIVDWHLIPDSLLRPGDFGERLTQRLGDLSDPSFFDEQSDTLASADLVFLDGPKDGIFEGRFASAYLSVARPGAILVIDDIRVMTMVNFWRQLPASKLDVTSFGHWSGTGLVAVP